VVVIEFVVVRRSHVSTSLARRYMT